MDEMFTMEPPPALRISGMAAFVPRNTPLALMSITKSHSSEVVSSTLVTLAMPALLTRSDEVETLDIVGDVQFAEPGDCGGHGVLPGALVDHIQIDEDTISAGFIDLGFGAFAVFIQNVADDNLGPFLGEHPGLDCPHTPGPAADQGHLVLQAHVFPQIKYTAAGIALCAFLSVTLLLPRKEKGLIALGCVVPSAMRFLG